MYLSAAGVNASARAMRSGTISRAKVRKPAVNPNSCSNGGAGEGACVFRGFCCVQFGSVRTVEWPPGKVGSAGGMGGGRL